MQIAIVPTNSEIIDFTVSQQSKQNDDANNLIEMEDISPKKAIIVKNQKSLLKTPELNQVNTTNKRKTNKSPYKCTTT